MKFSGKTVLITGASKGIGAATAIAFAKAGANVVINFRSDQDAAKHVLDECNNHSSNNMIFAADVADEDAVQEMFKQINNDYGSLDVVVNNAGIFYDGDSPTNIDAFEVIFRSNFLSAVMVTKHALGLMRVGKIINVSSIHGRLGRGRPGAIAYSSMKAALESYTKNLAKDLAPEILVNAVTPGRVQTPMWGVENEDEAKELGKAHLIERMIQPEEVAESIVFLAENDAMCGEVLTIDGGMSLKEN